MELLVSTAIDSENSTVGDLLVRGDQLVWSTDPVLEIAQRIRSRLRLFKGEWFLDRRIGIPYIQRVFAKVDDATLRYIFSRAIRETPGVADLVEFELTRDRRARNVTVRFVARLDTGATLTERSLVIDV